MVLLPDTTVTPVACFTGYIWFNCNKMFVCFWRNSPPVGQGLLIYKVFRSHTKHTTQSCASACKTNTTKYQLQQKLQHTTN